MHQASTKNLILVGPPNSGKTTLFNWLTNSRFRAVNYPGSTVECLRGIAHARYGRPHVVVDTPGIYSLVAESPDEKITVQLLEGDKRMGDLDTAIVCVDSTQLDRHLALILQVAKLGWPTVVALTMDDLRKEQKLDLKIEELEGLTGLSFVLVNGITGEGFDILIQRAQKLSNEKKIPAWNYEKTLRAGLDQVSHAVKKVREGVSLTSKIDRWALDPVVGYVAFFLVMVGLFSAVFWLAAPLMEGIDTLFSILGNFVHDQWGGGLLSDFVGDGVITSFASVIVFAPQIFILFVLVGLLEDSGYLARAATLVDKPLSALGLSGKSFVPLLSGFACAVPAILAARSIRSPRERWIAVFVIPLLSCSARLPVYALLLGFLFIEKSSIVPGFILALIYLGSFFVSAIAAGLLSRMLKADSTTSYIMELPVYRKPQWKIVLLHSMKKTQSYIGRAGPIIFALALLLWTATHFPRPENGNSSTSIQVQQSYAGQVGHWIEPVFRPMGLDWRVGVGLISAFAAREVFVSAMALVFDVTTDADETTIQENLIEKMRNAQLADGTPIFTFASIVGLILFFMIALQCTSTTAIALREMGSWKFAIAQLVVFNLVAYLAAVLAVFVLT